MLWRGPSTLKAVNYLPAMLAPCQFRRLRNEQSEWQDKELASTGPLNKKRNRTFSKMKTPRHSNHSLLTPSREYWVNASPNVKSQIATTATPLDYLTSWNADSPYINRSDQAAPRMRDILQDRPSRESRATLAAGQALWRYYLPIIILLQEFADRIL